MKDIVNDIWYPTIKHLLEKPGFASSFAIQPITKPMLQASRGKHGNALGLENDTEPLICKSK